MMTLLAWCKLKGMTAAQPLACCQLAALPAADSASAAGRTSIVFGIMAIYDAV